MANDAGLKTRGKSNYSIEIIRFDSVSRSGAAIVYFGINAATGKDKTCIAEFPITVDATGNASLNATAAAACEHMGDALAKMLHIVDELRDHYNKMK